MSKANVAKRYAEALFQIGVEKQTIDFLDTELATVREVFETNKKLLPFLQHPKVDHAKKQALLKEAFTGFSEDVLHTLSLLVDRHNVSIIPEVALQFTKLANESKGMKEAIVYSVRPLQEEEKQELETTFKKKLNVKALKITNQVDESIIGGVKIKVGNTIYDGTIKGKLDRLERKIANAN
ncbi:F0F1 ATP synthase subunit delta [Gracilibacillus dipsosauri]|uniref:ATP synthase subunit delta n=1 Tax=Gracilibacillus dipsosauri TaxID=178340 RepID=A0A317KUZ6_9BACI|nr:F0F1 ATP synthase subunit delta [Gracilibacillus dipsosauri]PWU66984.1 F0F1 ATP synthase subunit delta [Gracilibacillus dipsosauri]